MDPSCKNVFVKPFLDWVEASSSFDVKRPWRKLALGRLDDDLITESCVSRFLIVDGKRDIALSILVLSVTNSILEEMTNVPNSSLQAVDF